MTYRRVHPAVQKGSSLAGVLFLCLDALYVWKVAAPNYWAVLGLGALGGLAIFPSVMLSLASIWKGKDSG